MHVYTHTNVTYVCVYLEKQMCINADEPICMHAYISKLHVGAPQAVCELENVVYTCIYTYMHVCVYIYVCVRACIVLSEKKIVRKKNRLVTLGEEKKQKETKIL